MARKPQTSIILKFPQHLVTDSDFLDAVEGYARCLNPDQEAHLSREQLERLAKIGRRATG